jgi:mannose-6-phosphate isomerase-like protein (cupin superfamily)
MKKIHWNQISEPMTTKSGEIITELIGRASVDGEIFNHSLARIVIPPGKSSTLHYHKISQETYYILQGEGLMDVDGESHVLHPGTACNMQPGEKHRIENQGSVDLEFLAICAPAWVVEDSFEV